MLLPQDALRQDFHFDGVDLGNYVNLDLDQRELVRQWRSHETVRQWMYTTHIISPEEHARFIDALETDRRSIWWLLEVSSQPIAAICLNRLDFHQGNGYFGFFIDPDRVGGGLSAITEYSVLYAAFEFAGLHTLKLEVIASNDAVVRLHTGAGFQEEGRLRELVVKDGERQDVIIMGMLASEWGKRADDLRVRAQVAMERLGVGSKPAGG